MQPNKSVIPCLAGTKNQTRLSRPIVKLLGSLCLLLGINNAHALTTLQAENFSSMSGVQTETTSDTGGGLNVGWLDTGDWMAYPVNITTTGTYKVSYRIASLNGGGILQLEQAGGSPIYGYLNVPSTGGWQTWVTISHTVTLAAGQQTLGLAIKAGGWNLNWIMLEALDSSSSSTTTSAKVRAESYATMQGVQTETTTDTGGGLNVGWLDAGDWMSYSNTSVYIPSTGSYTVEFRVASQNGGGSLAFEEAGGAAYATVTVPNTGGWQTWTTVTANVTLSAGTHKFGVNARTGGWNFNWFNIKGATSSTTSSSSSSANNSGITAKQAAESMGKGFNLGQMFDNTQHPRTFAAAKAKIDAYYDKGFRNVRIPINWTVDVGGSKLVYDANVGNVNFGHERLAVIKQVVEYALSRPGMYVVINTHHEHGLKDNNQWWVLERLWQDIASIFTNTNHRLMYEVLNEPHNSSGGAMDPANLRFMTGKAYNKIRAVDPQRIILIGGNQWFGYKEMDAVWPNLDEVGYGQDQYLMAEFHHYNPWNFNGDNQGDYADNWLESDVFGPMDTMTNWANRVGHGMPVYIGEWGTGWGSRYGSMQCNNIRLFYQKLGSYAPAKGQPTAVWDDGGWFKAFDHGTNSFANNLVDCIGGSCGWDGAERFNSGCY